MAYETTCDRIDYDIQLLETEINHRAALRTQLNDVRRRIKKLGVASYFVPSISRELRGLEELVRAGQRGEVRYSEESSTS